MAINKTADPLPYILKDKFIKIGEVTPSYYWLPNKTYQDFKEIDSLSSVIGFLSNRAAEETALVQIIITPAYFLGRIKQ